MAIRNIRKENDPILKKKSRQVSEITDKEIQLLDDMVETMYHANGIGLAAVQVGVLKRIFVVDIGDDLVELINPVMTHSEGNQLEMEGCLSIPGTWGEVNRPLKVEMEALNRRGEKVVVKAENLRARALCHELDHLDGILFTEKVVRFVEPNELED